MAGRDAMSMVTEILFDVPGTAHILGGCPIGGSPADGVVDHATAFSATATCTFATAP